MSHSNLSVREIDENDFVSIVDYFLKADKDFLLGLGVDICKLPQREEWLKLLLHEYQQSIENKNFFYLIWQLDKKAIGHSNIDKIIFAERANMHLHMWRSEKRQQGLGFEFLKKCLPYYFDRFELKKLFCEPYALNQGPNATLKKLGFEFISKYETIPGWLNFHQPVNKWCMDFKKFRLLYG